MIMDDKPARKQVHFDVRTPTDNIRIPIGTYLRHADWERAKKTGLKWNNLILIGVAAKDNEVKMQLRLNELEELNRKLVDKISKLGGRILQLEMDDKGGV